MKLHEFAEKTLELFKQFECMDDSSYGCSGCPMATPDGGCLQSSVIRRVKLWVSNNET